MVRPNPRYGIPQDEFVDIDGYSRNLVLEQKLEDELLQVNNEINKQIKEQELSGVTPDQMKGLLQKKQMLELVTNNAEVINIIGKPIIKKLLGFVKSI